MNDFYFNDSFYNPENLEKLPQSQLRREYKRLRTIANNRLKEFDGTKWDTTKVYKSNKGKYDQNINEMTNRDLRYKLTEVHDFLSSGLSTVEGMEDYQNEVIFTLRSNGYRGINESNFLAFTEYMDRLELLFRDRLYDSRRAALLFSEEYKQNENGELPDIDTIIDEFEKSAR